MWGVVTVANVTSRPASPTKSEHCGGYGRNHADVGAVDSISRWEFL